jgi:RHS repeat-associated protein
MESIVDLKSSEIRPVELFHGEAVYRLPLIQHAGVQGPGTSLWASYRSSGLVGKSAPSPLGVGWSVYPDRVEKTPEGSFRLHSEGRAVRLYPGKRRWLRATLGREYLPELSAGEVSEKLAAALRRQGLAIAQGTGCTSQAGAPSWELTDTTHGETLTAEQSGEDIRFYDGGTVYEPEHYDYSRIRYYASSNRWAITTAAGITRVFGEPVAESQSVGTAVWYQLSEADLFRNTSAFHYRKASDGAILLESVDNGRGEESTLEYTFGRLTSVKSYRNKQPLCTTELSYGEVSLADGSRSFALTKVDQHAFDGASIASTKLSYYSDGLRPGALREVTLPQGSVTTYRYGSVTLSDGSKSEPVVSEVKVHDGFRERTVAYRYEEGVLDTEEKRYKFYKVSVFPGMEEGKTEYGHTEYRYLQPSAAGQPVPNGLPAAVRVYGGDGRLLSSEEHAYEFLCAVSERPGGEAVALSGSYTFPVKKVATHDGVSTITTMTCDSFTGNVRSTQVSNCNGEGKKELHRTLSRFAYEVSPGTVYLNVPGMAVATRQVVETEGKLVTVSATAQTLKVFEGFAEGLSLPLAYESFRWKGGDAGDFDFVDPAKNSRWECVSRSLTFSEDGKPLTQEDVLRGQTTSMLYDVKGRAVTVFNNADIYSGEVFYWGFETYEQAPVHSLPREWITDTSPHTGERSLCVPAATEGNAARAISLTLAARLLSFSCRGKYTGKGEAGWQVRIAGGGVDSIAEVRFEPSGEWQFYSLPIDLRGKSGVTLQLIPYNRGTGEAFTDFAGLCPREAPFSAAVYDERGNVIARIGPRQRVTRHYADGMGRQLVSGGDFDNVSEVYASAPSRIGDDDFLSSSPNSLVTIHPAGESFFGNFREEGLPKGWTASKGTWTAGKGQLAGSGTIVFGHAEAKQRYVAGISLSDSRTTEAAVGIGTGAVSFLWSPASKEWQLTAGTPAVIAASPAADPGSNWIVAATEEYVFFFVDGRLTFTYAGKERGALSLHAEKEVAFNHFFAGADPTLSAAFFDGDGKTLQTQLLEGRDVILSHTLYDDLERPFIVTQPVKLNASGTPFRFVADAVTEWDSRTGKIYGRISDAMGSTPGEAHYGYSRVAYEDVPTGRIIETRAPGSSYAVPEGMAERVEFGAGDGSEEQGLPRGEYLKRTDTGLDGKTTGSLQDRLGNTVLSYFADGSKTANRVAYSPSGRTETILLPNYFAPPAGSRPEDWQRVTEYDVNGKAVFTREPNSGISRFLYDSLGQLRFAQNAEQEAQGVIACSRYDDAGRVSEEGLVRAGWNESVLQEWIGSDTFPTVLPQRTFSYGDNGRLQELTVFDSEGSVQTTTRYAYDSRDRAVSVTVAGRDGTVSETSCAYAPDDSRLRTTYPSGRTVVHRRDGFGRETSLADEQGNTLVERTFNTFGLPESETNYLCASDPIRTEYSYSPQGWLMGKKSVTLSGKVLLEETLERATPDGRISAKELLFHNTQKEVNYSYGYDSLKRVSSVDFRIDGKRQPQSIGEIAYDANGNMLRVDGLSYGYRPGTDFIEAVGNSGKVFAADANGAVTTALPRGIENIRHDLFRGKPLDIERTNREAMHFVYDGGGKRLCKQTSEYAKVYGRDFSGRILTETTAFAAGKTVTADYIHDGHGIVGIVREGKSFAVIRDHLCTPVQVIDEGGAVAASFVYAPFGQPVNDGEYDVQLLPYLFNGYEWDAETGLYNAVARLYDPELRRFYSTDPKRQFASPYTFCDSDPVNFIDPNGGVRLPMDISWMGLASFLLFVVGLALAIYGRRNWGGNTNPFVGAACGVSANFWVMRVIRYFVTHKVRRTIVSDMQPEDSDSREESNTTQEQEQVPVPVRFPFFSERRTEARTPICWMYLINMGTGLVSASARWGMTFFASMTGTGWVLPMVVGGFWGAAEGILAVNVRRFCQTYLRRWFDFHEDGFPYARVFLVLGAGGAQGFVLYEIFHRQGGSPNLIALIVEMAFGFAIHTEHLLDTVDDADITNGDNHLEEGTDSPPGVYIIPAL